MAVRCYLTLGSNLGNRLANLQGALRRLSDAVAIDAVSPLYESDPAVPDEVTPTYIAACTGTLDLDPSELLALCGRIEWAMGRRPGFDSGSSPLEIDILMVEGVHRSTPDQPLPRPLIEERRSVLWPLRDIAPDLRLPGGGSVQQAADRLSDEGIRCIAGPEWRDAVAVAPPGQRIGVAASA